MDDFIKGYAAKMQKTVDVLKHDLTTIRAGRANPAVLEKITIDYYGAPTQINTIASISVPEPRVLAIQPWDVSALKLIEKAIQASDIGINPQNDGKIIRLLFPQLTEERRIELIRGVKKMGEESKVAVRNIRRDAVEKLKDMKKKSEITEDDEKSGNKDIQDETDRFCKMIDAEIETKEQELKTI